MLTSGPETQPVQPLDPVEGELLTSAQSRTQQAAFSLPKSRSSGLGFSPRKPGAQLPAPGAQETAGAEARKRQGMASQYPQQHKCFDDGFHWLEIHTTAQK